MAFPTSPSLTTKVMVVISYLERCSGSIYRFALGVLLVFHNSEFLQSWKVKSVPPARADFRGIAVLWDLWLMLKSHPWLLRLLEVFLESNPLSDPSSESRVSKTHLVGKSLAGGMRKSLKSLIVASIPRIYQHKEKQPEFLNKMDWVGRITWFQGWYLRLSVLLRRCILYWSRFSWVNSSLETASRAWLESCFYKRRGNSARRAHISDFFFPLLAGSWNEVSFKRLFQPKPFCECWKFCNFCSSVCSMVLCGAQHGAAAALKGFVEKWEVKNRF